MIDTNAANILAPTPVVRLEPWRKRQLVMQGRLSVVLTISLAMIGLLIWYILSVVHFFPLAYGLNFSQNERGDWVVTQVNWPAYQLGVSTGDTLVRAENLTPPYTIAALNEATSLDLRHVKPVTTPLYQISRSQVLNEPGTSTTTQLVLGTMATVYFAIGLLVYSYARQRRPALLFFNSCIAFGVAFFVSAISYNGHLSQLTTFLALSSAMFGVLSVFHFFVVFPQEAKLPAFLPFGRAIQLAYLVFGLLVVSLLPILVWPNSAILARPVVDLYLSIVALAGLITTLLKVFNAKSTQAGIEIRVIGLSMVLAFGPFFILQWLPQDRVKDFVPLIPQSFIYLPFLLLPVGFAYSIFQYQSLGIRNLLRRDLVRLLLAIFLASLYLLIFVFTDQFLGEYNFASQLVIVAAFSLVVTLSFNRLQKLLQELLDRLVFKDFYDYKPTLQDLTLRLTHQAELEELTRVLLSKLVQLFNLELAAMTICRRPPGQPIELYYNKIVRHSSRSGSILPEQLEAVTKVLPPQSTRFYLAWYSQVEQPMGVLELKLDQETSAILTLGPKVSEELFNLDDVTLVETLAGSIQASLQKVFLIDELGRKVLQLQSYSEQLRESKDELSELSQQVLRATEEERVRLAREIHDDPLQQITLITRQFDPQDPTITPREELAWRTARQVSATLRTICTELRPPHLDDMGLITALESLALQFCEQYGLCVEPTLDQDLPRLDPQIELVLYRVAQEALQNVVKHAAARHVQLELCRQGTTVILRVRDDGIGFEKPYRASHALAEGHMGLVGLRERIQSIGGLFNLSSAPGKGTLLETQVSL